MELRLKYMKTKMPSSYNFFLTTLKIYPQINSKRSKFQKGKTNNQPQKSNLFSKLVTRFQGLNLLCLFSFALFFLVLLWCFGFTAPFWFYCALNDKSLLLLILLLSLNTLENGQEKGSFI